MFLVGPVVGEKTVLNEFVAMFFIRRNEIKWIVCKKKSVIIATYILCGFAAISAYWNTNRRYWRQLLNRKSDLSN